MGSELIGAVLSHKGLSVPVGLDADLQVCGCKGRHVQVERACMSATAVAVSSTTLV